MEKEKINRELGRQLVHALIGLLLILLLLFLGRGHLIALLAGVLLFGSLLINWKMLGSKISFADWFEKKFERDATKFPGYGSAWYVVGALMLAIFLKNPLEIAVGIFILGIGDAVSTLVGIAYGVHKLPYNQNKSIEGSAAFFVFSLLSYFLIGWAAIPLAFVAAIAETLPLPYDDNIVLPTVCVIFFSLF